MAGSLAYPKRIIKDYRVLLRCLIILYDVKCKPIFWLVRAEVFLTMEALSRKKVNRLIGRL